MSLHQESPHASAPRTPERGERPRCLVVVAHPDRGLTAALVRHLSAELPQLDFTLHEQGAVHAIWMLGYEFVQAERLRELRRVHPQASLLVTARGHSSAWVQSALAAGADHAREWPVATAELLRLLSAGHLARAQAS